MKYYGGELMHYGIKGQRWGERRYQNEDGTLTEEGYRRYAKDFAKHAEKSYKGGSDRTRRRNAEMMRRDYYKISTSMANQNRINPETKKKIRSYGDASYEAQKYGDRKFRERYPNGANIRDPNNIAEASKYAGEIMKEIHDKYSQKIEDARIEAKSAWNEDLKNVFREIGDKPIKSKRALSVDLLSGETRQVKIMDLVKMFGEGDLETSVGDAVRERIERERNEEIGLAKQPTTDFNKSEKLSKEIVKVQKELDEYKSSKNTDPEMEELLKLEVEALKNELERYRPKS